MPANTFDYIVVGAGAAGAAVAARLTESAKYTVLCLEAGTKGPDYIWSIPPAASLYMYDDPTVNWCYYSEPHQSHGNRRIYAPRGKLLGGSTAMNGMVCNRGQAADYDGWAQLGCRGWSYNDVLPFFKKLESTDIGSDRYRGRTGPLKITVAPKLSPFYDLFIQSAMSVGIPYNADYNGEIQDGVALAQQTVHRGRRVSTATHYLKPARHRANLTVVSGAEATSLIIAGKQCVGVRYSRNGVTHEARASREVIVSCGTANSPKLLELSGIGNPEILKQHGIEVLHELKGVGENLRDHYSSGTKWRFNKPGISLSAHGRGHGLLREIVRYVLFRTGFITMVFGSLRAFTRSQPDLDRPDMLILAAPFIVDIKPHKERRVLPVEGCYVNGHVLRTESAGSIHIRSPDPFAPPTINFRFLETENDRRIAIAVIRRIRELMQAPPLGEFVAEELAPGSQVRSDEQILDFLRNTGGVTHHMVGTCKMGNDATAVVDHRLRVRGIKGLRIADASIMPTIPSGNTAIPAVMIGEKCAAMVLEDADDIAHTDRTSRRNATVPSTV